MKKIATITFHAAHNYGSVLQAYALQKTLEKFGCKCDIINFRTDKQKEMYSLFTKRKGLKYILKNLSHLFFCLPLRKKYDRFEAFIENKLVKTADEYKLLSQDVCENFDYDYYICGSDQIWNPVPADFDWAYFLPFDVSGKKISYAPSFGPLASIGDNETQLKMKEYLSKFDSISVREKKSQEAIEQITGKKVPIVIDPTLLLSSSEWKKLIATDRIIKEDYIFLYTLFASPEIIKIAKAFSKKLKMPVVVSNFTNQYDIFTPFRKHYDCGPEEFLNLINNASLVLASSFHGTVFSIILQKPFFSIGGADDARISSLLNYAGLSDRSININSVAQKVQTAFNISFEETEIKLNPMINESINYIRKVLEL